jgi:hypothetical protein
MGTGVELQPDELAVLQAEPAYEPPVSVTVAHVSTPVRTQALPRESAATRTRTVTTTALRLLAADPRRASATIIASGGNILIAFSMASAADPSTMALWPAATPYTLTADTELYVAASTGTVTVSVITEYWAAGE